MSGAAHVVERCPSCGVEHEAAGGCCEACGTPLRPWCRRHGREAGWLPGPHCPRCAEEAARPPVAARARATAPAPAPDRPASSSWPGGRSPREILRGGPPRTERPTPVPEAQQSIPYAIGEVLGVGIVGWITGAVLGLMAGLVTVGDAILVGRLGGQLFGLAGLVVGTIIVIAKRASRREE